MVSMATITPAYRLVMALSTPAVKWWGRLEVSGLEHLPAEGPVLLAGNHDSYWDTVTIGLAAMPKRQIKALAKSSLWKPGLGKVLDGMGQIPIERGKGDQNAMARAEQELRAGACIGIFPEGTRSLGRELPARSGLGRLAEAVPEAEIVCCTVVGTVDVPKFPKDRPRLTVRFFRPTGGGLQPGESHRDFGARLLAEIRAEAPLAHAGRRKLVQPKVKATA
jgi:1-acyl-sn-glycerol-3-phosphate acyltransferase